MKVAFTLSMVIIIYFSASAQTITNPSNEAGYDQQKLLLINRITNVGLSLVTDSADYQPGSTATINGGGFLAGETVVLQVMHAGGLPDTGADHHPWNVLVEANGTFITTWHVCEDDCIGAHLKVTAIGQSSGSTAVAKFTDNLLSESCYFEPDETYSEFPNNDDGSIGPIQLPFIFDLYGTPYSEVWINNNGNLTFTGPLSTFNAAGFPFNVPMVAAFWSDIDTRPLSSGIVKYKLNATNLIVTWPGVGYFSGQTDKLNTFQIIISNGIDPLIGAGNNVAFYFDDMQWTTGSASNGTDGFGGIPATVGINKGNNVDYIQVGRFNEDNANYNGGSADNSGVNYLDYQCFPFNVTGIINQQPSVSGLPAGNSIDIICGETKTISLTFLPPEPYQLVTSTVDDGEICNSIISVTDEGAVSNADVTITAAPCNIGTHTISFSATDNFVIPATNTIEITVNILPLSTSQGGTISVCKGGILNLTSDGGTSYSWTGPNEFSSNEQNPSISNITEDEEGTYDVVVTNSYGCIASASTIVNVISPPLPAITLNTPLYDCPDAFSIITVTDTSGENNEPYNYLWSPNGEVTSTISVSQPGTYGVAISNNIGCLATIDTTIVLLPCIVGYYPPPPEGKIEDKIGAELTQLVGHPDTVLNTTNNNIYLTKNGSVLIEVISNIGVYDNLLQTLILNGMTEIIDNGTNTLIITGFFPINNLLSLNLYPTIDYVRPYFPPQSNFNINGATFSLGDKAMLSDSARHVFNVQGEGVKVGIISDSYNKQGGAELNIIQGDLPGVGNIYNSLPVEVVKEYPYGIRSDEGRAMMEIVHDIAPKAELAFRTGFVSPGDFSVGIKELQQHGCDIIVDDVTYITEPYFQDGVVAKAVDYVKDLGVSYFSAAGNFGSNSYEAIFNPGPTPVPDGYTGAVHNFNGAGDIYQSVSLGLDPGQAVGIYSIVLQWEDNFYSLGQAPGAINDLDIYLVDNSGNRLFGFNRNNIGGDPLEILPFIVRGPTQANIMIVRDSGLANVRFKYIVFRGNITINEYRTGVSTLVGQANAAGAMAVGAAFYFNTPAFGLDTATVASFSSIGGTSVYGEDRHKPDFVAPNGGNSTVEFGSPNIDEPDPFPNFFGTSSSAPHAAGVAALLLDGRKKFYDEDLLPDDVRSILKSTALAMGSSVPDSASGSGLIQADKALQSFATAMPVIDSLGFPIPPFIPGTAPFTVSIYGNYLSDSSKIIFDNDTLVSVFVNHNVITASVPFFNGNPPLQVYTPPTTPSNLDGGFSNSLYFITDGKNTITVTTAFETKKFGEVNPDFLPLVLVGGQPIENTTTTLAELGLDNLEYATFAANLSDVGIYTVSPLNPFDPSDPIDAAFLALHNYVFNDGYLVIEKMPLIITPRDTTLTYGDKVAGIQFNYEYDNSNIDSLDRVNYLNSIEEDHESNIDTALAIINGRIVINRDGVDRTIATDDLEESAFLASVRSITNGRIVINRGGLDASVVVDVSPETVFDYQEDSLNTSIVNNNALANGYSLTNGTATVNGRIVNSGNAFANSSTVSKNSNEKVVAIVDAADIAAPPDDSIAIKSVNVITGLYAGSHVIVPGAFMSGNFDISYKLGNLTILPKLLFIQPDNKEDTCGQKPEFTLKINGLQYDDSLSPLFVDPLSYSVFNDQNVKVDSEILPQGIYSIHADVQLLPQSNYIIQQLDDGILTSAGPLLISHNGEIKCAGDYACLDIIASGGTPPYSGTQTFCGYSAGSYPFVVMDNKGCSAEEEVILVEPPALILTVTQDEINCYGETTCIHVATTGGVSPYQGTGTFCGFNAGSNYIETTDANNCIVSEVIEIIAPSKINVTTTVTDAACVANGIATANEYGGTPGYTYLWLPGGQTSQTVTGLAEGTYTVKVTDSNGCTSTSSANVGFSGAILSPPGSIIGFAGVCKKQTGVTYCITPVLDATSYLWSLPKGASIVGPETGNCITINFSTKFNGGYLCVQAQNSCSISPSTCKNIVLLNKAPKTPGSMLGPLTLCPLTTGAYMIAPVKDATSYEWSGTEGLTIISGQGTTSVLVEAPTGFISGNIKVSASNCKGVSGTRVKKVNGLPAKPLWKGNNTIVGACGGQIIDYEIEQVSGALSYIWSGPINSVLSDGFGNTGNPLTLVGKNNNGKYSVQILFPVGFVSGSINVFANNVCGQGPTATLQVISVPEKPGEITMGHLSVCKSEQNVVYKILNLPGTTSNTWTITGGAVITNNANNNSANVNFLTTATNPVVLSVTANNACGSSLVTNYFIDVNFACRTNDDESKVSTGNFEVYPNPVKSKVNIRLDGKIVKKSDVKIFNLLGETLPVIVTNISTNEGVELDLSGFTNGLYIIRINIDEEYKIFQIIKE